jgi:hypothetical protein
MSGGGPSGPSGGPSGDSSVGTWVVLPSNTVDPLWIAGCDRREPTHPRALRHSVTRTVTSLVAAWWEASIEGRCEWVARAVRSYLTPAQVATATAEWVKLNTCSATFGDFSVYQSDKRP